jgi:hypothetical protein
MHIDTPTVKKPWCSYAVHRTASWRRVAGRRSNRAMHGMSKRRHDRLRDQWWQQATTA